MFRRSLSFLKELEKVEAKECITIKVYTCIVASLNTILISITLLDFSALLTDLLLN